MSEVLAIVPARRGSEGIPYKNFELLAGQSCVERAIHCAQGAGIAHIVLSTDMPKLAYDGVDYLRRPPALANATASMRDVVAHVLASVPGPPDQVVLIVQPTQPLRTIAHLRAALRLMATTQTTSVISITPTTSAEKCVYLDAAGLASPMGLYVERRQDARPAYRCDGTVYAFYRRAQYISFPAIPLLIPLRETCPLDTMDDWEDAKRRLLSALAF